MRTGGEGGRQKAIFVHEICYASAMGGVEGGGGTKHFENSVHSLQDSLFKIYKYHNNLYNISKDSQKALMDHSTRM